MQSTHRKEQVKKGKELVKHMAEHDKNLSGVGRRQFLRSIFGLGTVAEGQSAEAKPGSTAGKFFWADLKRGQMGFPCGHSIPSGMPGSIMKLVAAAALTDVKLMSPDEKFECRGVYKIHNETYKCLYPHGIIDMVHAVGLSCNVYFAHASQKMSARTVLEYARKFGLDKTVANFGAGRFPQDRLGTSSEKYVLGLAEDLQPNALQILRLAALIANEGKVPYLHSAESPDSSQNPFELELSNASWHLLKHGMQIASREGTGKKLDPENKMKVAIKTGTTPHGTTFQSWITGYFPWDAPRYAFVLRAPAGTSQDEAVPQARAFLFSAEWP